MSVCQYFCSNERKFKIMKRTVLLLMLIVVFSASGCNGVVSERADKPGSFSLNSLYRGSPDRMRFDTVRKKDPKALAHERISEKWTLDMIRGSEARVGLDTLK